MYTAIDFHRYFSGLMSEAERHALEKAALEDPFLADALDGYAFTPTAEEDIKDLKQKLLANEQSKKRSLFVAGSKKIWWRAAAIVLLTAGIAYLAWEFNGGDRQSPLAKREKNLNVVPETSSTPAPAIDSLKKDGNTVPIEQNINEEQILAAQAERTNQRPTKFTEQQKVVKNSLRKDGSVDESVPGKTMPLAYENFKAEQADSSDKMDKENLETLKPAALAKQMESKINKYNFTGNIVDSKGNAVPYATITEKNSNKAYSSDASGKFLITGNDSSLSAHVSAVGYNRLDQNLSYNNSQTIVLTPNDRELSAVVVTSTDATRQKKAMYQHDSILEGKVPGVTITTQPANGADNFNRYVIDSIKRPASLSGQAFKGEVLLSFKIRKNGEPYKIRVEKSLCPACDAEAIRLLHNGPRWKYVNDKRATQSIIF